MMFAVAQRTTDTSPALKEGLMLSIPGWTLYLIAITGAIALFCLLPRPSDDKKRRKRALNGVKRSSEVENESFQAVSRRGLRDLGNLLGAATLAALILWLISRPHVLAVLPIDLAVLSPAYYVLAALALATAVRAVTHPRPVYCVLYFMMTVLAVTAILVLIQGYFLAIALVLIYAGAILVTYVFVIMLAGHATAGEPPGSASYDVRSRQPIGALLAGFTLLAAICGPLGSPRYWPARALSPMERMAGPPDGTAAAMGHELFRHHLLALELAGVLLLVAIVGAVAVSRKRT